MRLFSRTREQETKDMWWESEKDQSVRYVIKPCETRDTVGLHREAFVAMGRQEWTSTANTTAHFMQTVAPQYGDYHFYLHETQEVFYRSSFAPSNTQILISL